MGQLYLTTFGASEWIILSVWILAVVSPIAYSIRNKTPIALGISVGLLLGYIVQYAFVVMASYGLEFRFVWFDFWLIPSDWTPWSTIRRCSLQAFSTA